MGWERKRGKIEEFNRLLRGATDTGFTVQVGDPRSCCRTSRYCITLDSDTRLPRDTARQLIGVIEHPLNRPRFDPPQRHASSRATASCSRASASPWRARRARCSRALYAGHTGVDPYTTAVSDTYQDLFGEGSFTGKGLYDVDAFTGRARRPRARERDVVARPVRGAARARCALVSDVEIVDDFPSSVLAHARRQHRWVRGDWQILFWLLPVVPTRHGLERNTPAAHQPLEDLRQPASQPDGAVRSSLLLAGRGPVLPGRPGAGPRPNWRARVPAAAAFAAALRGRGRDRTVLGVPAATCEDRPARLSRSARST